MSEPRPAFYDQLAEWWPLFSPPEHYGEEAADLLVHDAIMYATEPADMRATLETAAVHCRPGGTVAVLPDFVRETFIPGTDHGGHDADDGRGLRYLEWRWDPDPADDTYLVEYAFLLRDRSGLVRAVHDRHLEGLFPRARWLEWFEAAGLSATSSVDQWGRDVFIATPRPSDDGSPLRDR